MTRNTALARFLRDVPPLFEAEKPVSFDPVQMTFLQKLVRESALQGGLTLRKQDFFKGIVYADYFMEVVAARSTLLDDVKVLVAELEKLDPYLDVDLTMLVRYSGLYVNKDLRGDAFFKPPSLAQVRRRHERANEAVAPAAETIDLFHGAVARFTNDLVARDETRAALERCTGRADVRAALACDAMLVALPDADVSAEAKAALASGPLVEAVVQLVACLTKSSRGFSLKAYVEAMPKPGT